jgi:hypothetical protein
MTNAVPLRRIVGMIGALLAVVLLLADCPEPPSGPGGGWKKVASDDQNNRPTPRPGAPIYFNCPFC